MTWNKKQILPIAILSIGILIFTALKLTKPIQLPVAPQERIWYVDTLKISPKQLSPTQKLYGRTETPDLIKATAPRDSRVENIFVREGSSVTRDQLILQLDARDFQPVVIQKQAQVSELEAMITSEKLHHNNNKQALKHQTALLDISKAGVERAKKMKAKNLGSDAALDQAKLEMEKQTLSVNERSLSLNDHPARLQQLQARLTHAQADLDLAKLDLERSQVHSPFNGYVSTVEVATGDYVKANQHLISLYPTNTLEVRTLIPAPLQNELQNALSNGTPLNARAEFAGRQIALKLNRLSGAASTKGIDGLFTLTKGTDALRVGSSLSLYLLRPPHKNSIILPYSALYGHNKIYKLIEQRMQSVHVTHLGNFSDSRHLNHLLVTSPELKSGDSIIVTHLPNAIDGLRVQSKQPPAINSASSGNNYTQ